MKLSLKNIKPEVKIASMMVLGAIAMIIGVVIGESAKSSAGWTFGDILAVAGLLSFVGGFAWLVMINKASDKTGGK